MLFKLYFMSEKKLTAQATEQEKNICDNEDSDHVVTNINELLDYYRKSHTKAKGLMVGIEVEKSGIHRDDFSPLQYEEKGGYLDILKKLVQEIGWEIIDGDKEKGYIYELQRGDSRITTEADGRLELASKPSRNLHTLAREFRIHQNEVKEISGMFGVAMLGIGWQPFHKVSEIKYAPKPRYLAMTEYKKKRRYSEEYSKKTNSIHINFDFASLKDSCKRMSAIAKISPVIAAMFSCSAINEGKVVPNHFGWRYYHIQKYDPSRCGLPKFFFKKNFSYEDWVDFVLDLPLIYINRENKGIFINKITFRQFMKDGYDGFYPTIKDWKLHIKSVWTDVRLKRNYIELRSCDSVPPFLTMAAPTLIKGLMREAEGLKVIDEITKKWSFEDVVKLQEDVAKKALQAQIKKLKVLDIAKQLLDVSTKVLQKNKIVNEKGQDESIYLKPIKDFIFVKEKSPARYLVEQWKGEWSQNPYRLIEWCEY